MSYIQCTVKLYKQNMKGLLTKISLEIKEHVLQTQTNSPESSVLGVSPSELHNMLHKVKITMETLTKMPGVVSSWLDNIEQTNQF